jgi:futalosine hydrolase
MNKPEIQDSILIASAVAGETEAIAQAIEDGRILTIGGHHAVRGNLSGKDILLLITGPGMVNTAQALGAAIERIRPSLIIQCGCAGIFGQTTGRIGDIGIAERETDIHTGIEPLNPMDILPTPLPFPLLETENGPVTNTYPMNKDIIAKAFTLLQNLNSDGTRVFKGPFITVSTITATDERAEKLYTAFNPIMESMEGSAAAHVALHYRIPFLEIRAASNIVGRRDRNSWNLPLSFKNNALAVMHLIKHIDIS